MTAVHPRVQALVVSSTRDVVEADLAGRIAYVDNIHDALYYLRKWRADGDAHAFKYRNDLIDRVSFLASSVGLDRVADELLTHVREAWGYPTTYVKQTSDPAWWGVRCPGFGGYMGVGPNKLSALVAALVSAP